MSVDTEYIPRSQAKIRKLGISTFEIQKPWSGLLAALYFVCTYVVKTFKLKNPELGLS